MYQPMPTLIGHRGLPTEAPENTAASVRLAAEQKIGWVEIDVTMAGDGSLVIMHDHHLKRFGQPQHYLKDLNASALRKVDAGGWFSTDFAGEPLLFLPQLLALVKTLDLGLNLEIKINPDMTMPAQVDAVYQTLKQHPLVPEQLLVSSFDHAALRHFRQHSGTVQIGALFERLPATLINGVLDLQPVSIHCDQAHLTAEQARHIVPHYPLYCYTVNDTATFTRLLSWGVSGIFCDRANAEEMRAIANNQQPFQPR